MIFFKSCVFIALLFLNSVFANNPLRVDLQIFSCSANYPQYQPRKMSDPNPTTKPDNDSRYKKPDLYVPQNFQLSDFLHDALVSSFSGGRLNIHPIHQTGEMIVNQFSNLTHLNNEQVGIFTSLVNLFPITQRTLALRQILQNFMRLDLRFNNISQSALPYLHALAAKDRLYVMLPSEGANINEAVAFFINEAVEPGFVIAERGQYHKPDEEILERWESMLISSGYNIRRFDPTIDKFIVFFDPNTQSINKQVNPETLVMTASGVMLHEFDHAAMALFERTWMIANLKIIKEGGQPDKYFKKYTRVLKDGTRILNDSFLHLMRESRGYMITAFEAIETIPGIKNTEQANLVIKQAAQMVLMDYVERYGFEGLEELGIKADIMDVITNPRIPEIVLNLAHPERGPFAELNTTIRRAGLDASNIFEYIERITLQ